MKVGYRLKDKFDLEIFIPTILLTMMGLIAIYSATVNHPTASSNFSRQLFWAIGSIITLFLVYAVPSQFIKFASVPSYIASIVLLIAVHFIGKQVYGAKSWLNLGFFGFQPSEFAKIGTILMLAYWLSEKKRNLDSFKEIATALVIGGIPILLILLEPDFGTSIVFVAITVTMVFWSGISLFSLFMVLSPGVAAFASLFGTISFLISILAVVILLFYFKKNIFTSASVLITNIAAGFFFDFALRYLRPHQQNRILTFINPETDPLGAGYNALQAKVAIGSGGLFGKGYLHGNQTQLRYIPEQWTDFIFCVIGEEFGFIGSIITLGLFVYLFIRLINLSYNASNKFSSLVVIGVLSLMFTHFAINLGMNLGVTPVVGLPLPFLSYGGSSLLVNIILIGFTLNIYNNRKQS
ncbi:MAG: rod shape-determining protein RodA [bacterium]